MIASDTKESSRLLAESDSSFVVEGTESRVTFVRSAEGSISHRVIRADGHELAAKRLR